MMFKGDAVVVIARALGLNPFILVTRSKLDE